MDERLLQTIEILPPQKGENPQAFAQIQSKNNWVSLENVIMRENRFEIRGGLKQIKPITIDSFFNDDEKRKAKDYLVYKKEGIYQQLIVYTVAFMRRVTLGVENEVIIVFDNQQERDNFLEFSKDLYAIKCYLNKQELIIESIEKDFGETDVLIKLDGEYNIEDGDELTFYVNLIAIHEGDGGFKTFFPISDKYYLVNHYDLILFGGYQQPIQVWNGKELVKEFQEFNFFTQEKHDLLSDVGTQDDKELFAVSYKKEKFDKFFKLVEEKIKDDTLSLHACLYTETDKIDIKIIDASADKEEITITFSSDKGKESPIFASQFKLRMFFNSIKVKDLYSSRDFLIGKALDAPMKVYVSYKIDNTWSWYDETDLTLGSLDISTHSQGDEIIGATELRDHTIFFLKNNIQIWRGNSIDIKDEKLFKYSKTIQQGLVAPKLYIKTPAGLFFLTNRGISTFVSHPENQSDISYLQLYERDFEIEGDGEWIDFCCAYSPKEDIVLFFVNPKGLLCLSLNGNSILGVSIWQLADKVNGLRYTDDDFIFWHESEKEKFSKYKKDTLKDFKNTYPVTLKYYFQSPRIFKNKLLEIEQQMLLEKKNNVFKIACVFKNETNNMVVGKIYQEANEEIKRKKILFPFYAQSGVLIIGFSNEGSKNKNVIRKIKLMGETV